MQIAQNKYLKFSMLLFCLLCFTNILSSYAQVVKKRQAVLMGSVFHFTLVDKDSSTATRHMEEVIAEISRIENLI